LEAKIDLKDWNWKTLIKKIIEDKIKKNQNNEDQIITNWIEPNLRNVIKK
jgi:hypothetical protein